MKMARTPIFFLIESCNGKMTGIGKTSRKISRAVFTIPRTNPAIEARVHFDAVVQSQECPTLGAHMIQTTVILLE